MIRALTLGLLIFAASTGPAFAHSSTRGFVLLLPTGYVIAGGTLTVLATFALLALSSDRFFRRKPKEPKVSGYGVASSLVSTAILAVLVWVGLRGPTDPAENLLPLSIWTLWWVLLVLLHAVFGDLWRAINPFTGLHALAVRLSGGRLSDPPLVFQKHYSYWPALLIFAAFAWFQLVDSAPEDPGRLATLVISYFALTLLATFVFGPANWFEKADPFSIFFSQLAAAAFFSQLAAAAPVTRRGPRLPGTGLRDLLPLPLAGTLFVLMTLSAISFDGFANTFLWLSMIGVNPLDYPGRTALMGANTLGLTLSFAVLATLYLTAALAGWLWSGRPISLEQTLGRFVLSLIPISIAYHFAHYLGDLAVNLQYLALALNDPWGSGGNYLGLKGMHVTASVLNSASGSLLIFSLQTSAVVLGHIVSIIVSHAMAHDYGLRRSRVLKLQAPLAAVMLFYTAFGLWLLATPAIS